jgi:hypothetical protein
LAASADWLAFRAASSREDTRLQAKRRGWGQQGRRGRVPSPCSPSVQTQALMHRACEGQSLVCLV